MSSEIPALRTGSALPVPSPVTPRATGEARARTDAARARTVLDRSGIDLSQLLADGDRLVERNSASLIELTTRLEAARGALVRNNPADVLALLDETWESAQHTEQGWYLRGSALAALGLPGEALRVSDEALKRRPRSVALRFLGSLARLLVGDNTGARALLQDAIEDAPDDALLLAHHAVVTSRSGHRDAATQLLQRAAIANPDHPAVQYARAWISADRAQSSRNVSREGDVVADPDEAQWEQWHKTSPGSDSGKRESAVRTGSDSLDATFRRLGDVMRSPAVASDVPNHSRVLLRTLAGGGTIATANGAERTHAARSLLSQIVAVWNDANSDETAQDTEPPGRHAAVKPILAALRDGNRAGARQLMLQSEARIPASSRSLLRALLDDDEPRRRARTPLSNSGASETIHDIRTDRAHYDANKGVIGPVRLGLALIEDKDVSPSDDTVARSVSASHMAIDRATLSTSGDALIGWDAVAGNQPRASSRGARIVAVICVVAAITAAAVGKPVVALALAGGASWLALRRGHRLELTAEYKAAEHSAGGSR